MAQLTATQRPNLPARLLGQFVDLLRSEAAQPEFLPFQPMTALMPLESMEKLSYGDPLFRMPQQSNIPMTVDREYLIDALGLASMAPSASRATTRLSNEAADALVRAITRNPEATAPEVLEAAGQMLPMSRITTYHGSPYLFRQFDTARVGTGEGAQAYGVGSGYTAEARGVAEGYREGIKDMGSIKAINEKMDELVKVMESDSEYPGAYRKFKSEKGRKAAEEYDALIQQRSEIRNAPGYLYKGEIPDEVLPRFLDWDKPLTRDAPQEVKDSFNSIVQKYPELKEPFFKAFRENKPGSHYYAILNDYAKTGDLYKNQLFASKVLEDAGIRGIRYLDQGSRGEGKGTSNFIPFRPEDYRIQEINDTPIEQYMEQGLL